MEEQRILNQITQSDCGEERGQWCGLRELHQEFDSKAGCVFFPRNVSRTWDDDGGFKLSRC